MKIEKRPNALSPLDIIANYARKVKLNWHSWDVCASVKDKLLLQLLHRENKIQPISRPNLIKHELIFKRECVAWRRGGPGAPATVMTVTNEEKTLEQQH